MKNKNKIEKIKIFNLAKQYIYSVMFVKIIY
jgi:hypothetical protein